MWYKNGFILLFLMIIYKCESNHDDDHNKRILTASMDSLLDSNHSVINITNTLITDSTTIKTVFNKEFNLNNNTNITLSNNVTLPENNITSNNSTEPVSEVAPVQEQPTGGGVLHYLKTLFKSKPAIGENCNKSEDCDGRNSICQDGVCQCQPDYVPANDNHNCLAVIKALGEGCIEDAQCHSGLNLPEGDVLCISFRCVCGTDTIYRNGTCLRSIYLGDKCESDNDCLTVNSHCTQGVCACPMEMIPGADNKICLPALKTVGSNSKCEQDAQCQEIMGDFAICQSGQCACKAGSHFSSNKCLEDLKLGSTCTKTSDCQISEINEAKNRRICLNNKCSCAEGFKSLEDSCGSSANTHLISYSLVLLTTVLLRSIY